MSIKFVLVAVAMLAAPSAALACTPVAPAKLTTAEQRVRALTSAELAASPRLARQIREAADISVVSILGFDPGPDTDIPPYYRSGYTDYQKHGLGPVRYRLKVDRVLKGSPAAEFWFRIPTSWSPEDGERVWTVAPSDDFQDFSMARSQMTFWHNAYLALGQISGGPGDCSNQVALDPEHTYLIVRDATGMVTAAEPLTADDPLPNLVADLVADPKLEYPWQPTVREFLALPGVVLLVRISNCREEQGKVVEMLRHRPDDLTGDAVEGETLDLYGLEPGFLVANCHIGSSYLVTGWPFSTRLHPVVDGTVQFEDRWMQLRFAGAKTMPLDTVRAILAGAS